MSPTPRRTKGPENKTPKRKETEDELEQIEPHEATPVLQWKNLATATQRAFKSVNDKTTVYYNPKEQPQFVETSGKGKTILNRSRKEEQETPRKRTRSESSTSREPRGPPEKRKSINKSGSRNSRKLSRSLEPHKEQNEDPEDQEIEKDDTVVFGEEHIRDLTENSDSNEIILKSYNEEGKVNEGASCSNSTQKRTISPEKSIFENAQEKTAETKGSKKRKRRTLEERANTDDEKDSPQSTPKKNKTNNQKASKKKEQKDNEGEKKPETISIEEVSSLLEELGLDVERTLQGYQFIRSANSSKVTNHFESLKSAIKEVVSESERSKVAPIKEAMLKLEEVLVGNESDELRNMLNLVKSSSNKSDPARAAAKLIIRGSPRAMGGITREDSRDLSRKIESSLVEFIIKTKIAFSEFWEAVDKIEKN